MDSVRWACRHYKVVIIGMLVLSSAGGMVAGMDLTNRSSLRGRVSLVPNRNFAALPLDPAKLSELAGSTWRACTALPEGDFDECIRGKCWVRETRRCASRFVELDRSTNLGSFDRCREEAYSFCEGSSVRKYISRPAESCSGLRPRATNYYKGKTVIDECVRLECREEARASCVAGHTGRDGDGLRDCIKEIPEICS